MLVPAIPARSRARVFQAPETRFLGETGLLESPQIGDSLSGQRRLLRRALSIRACILSQEGGLIASLTGGVKSM